MSKELLPHQERVVTEQKELEDKITKLTTFSTTDFFRELSPIDQNLLSIQLDSMRAYNNVLKMRISRF